MSLILRLMASYKPKPDVKLYIKVLTFPADLSSHKASVMDVMSPTILTIASLSSGLTQRSAIFSASSRIALSARSPVMYACQTDPGISLQLRQYPMVIFWTTLFIFQLQKCQQGSHFFWT